MSAGIRWIGLVSGTVAAVSAFATPPSTQAERVVLGKLGQAVQKAEITSKPGAGRRYYTLKPYEYLVLRTGPKGFYKVLLQNGAEGYVRSSTIARLPYDVTQSKPTRRSGSTDFAGTRLVAATADSRARAAASGLNYRGTPYRWGGNDPLNGIDCSAFVRYLYGRIGVNLPRTAAEQVRYGTPINNLEDLRPGDRLYFWSSKRNTIGHTGAYLGNGYFVHSVSGRGVVTDYLTERWLKILVAARR